MKYSIFDIKGMQAGCHDGFNGSYKCITINDIAFEWDGISIKGNDCWGNSISIFVSPKIMNDLLTTGKGVVPNMIEGCRCDIEYSLFR